MENELKIERVETKIQWRSFINLPWQINSGDKNWTPPLKISLQQMFDFRKNPFWKNVKSEFFIALKGTTTVGRISSIIVSSLEEERTGCFGFLEAVNDKTVFEQLFIAAEKSLIKHGCKKIIGPLNPSINYELGVLIDGFEFPSYFMLSHNPDYYDEKILQTGYKKEIDFYSYYVGKDDFIVTDKLKRTMALLLKRSQLRVREVKIKKFNDELKIFHDIYNDSFSKHWGFVPMELDEFHYMAKDLTQIMDPELVLVIEYKNKPVGFLLTLPNFNEVFSKIHNGKLFPFGIFKYFYYKRKIKTARIITVAIKQQYQHLGLGSFLYFEVGKRIIEKGYVGAEMSWVVENNIQMNKAAKEMGGRVYKTYRLYSKEV